jgi:hypothetical protein
MFVKSTFRRLLPETLVKLGLLTDNRSLNAASFSLGAAVISCPGGCLEYALMDGECILNSITVESCLGGEAADHNLAVVARHWLGLARGFLEEDLRHLRCMESYMEVIGENGKTCEFSFLNDGLITAFRLDLNTRITSVRYLDIACELAIDDAQLYYATKSAHILATIQSATPAARLSFLDKFLIESKGGETEAVIKAVYLNCMGLTLHDSVLTIEGRGLLFTAAREIKQVEEPPHPLPEAEKIYMWLGFANSLLPENVRSEVISKAGKLNEVVACHLRQQVESLIKTGMNSRPPRAFWSNLNKVATAFGWDDLGTQTARLRK